MLAIKKIDHINIVVPQMDQAMPANKGLLFSEPCTMEYFEENKVDLALFDIRMDGARMSLRGYG